LSFEAGYSNYFGIIFVIGGLTVGGFTYDRSPKETAGFIYLLV
jgi:hypothetical protein